MGGRAVGGRRVHGAGCPAECQSLLKEGQRKGYQQALLCIRAAPDSSSCSVHLAPGLHRSPPPQEAVFSGGPHDGTQGACPVWFPCCWDKPPAPQALVCPGSLMTALKGSRFPLSVRSLEIGLVSHVVTLMQWDRRRARSILHPRGSGTLSSEPAAAQHTSHRVNGHLKNRVLLDTRARFLLMDVWVPWSHGDKVQRALPAPSKAAQCVDGKDAVLPEGWGADSTRAGQVCGYTLCPDATPSTSCPTVTPRRVPSGPGPRWSGWG